MDGFMKRTNNLQQFYARILERERTRERLLARASVTANRPHMKKLFSILENAPDATPIDDEEPGQFLIPHGLGSTASRTSKVVFPGGKKEAACYIIEQKKQQQGKSLNCLAKEFLRAYRISGVKRYSAKKLVAYANTINFRDTHK
jgi:hypothetical protein